MLFGDSLTEWSFDSSTQGFGWYLSRKYQGKAEIVNQGNVIYQLASIHQVFNPFTESLSTVADLSSRICGVNAPKSTFVTRTNRLSSYTSEHVKPEFTRLMERLTAIDAPPTILFTIFLGANDACFVGDREYVPLPQFLDNIHSFIEEILINDELADAKIVLITPSPINVPEPLASDDESLGPAFTKAMKKDTKKDPKQDRGYRTYMNKKRYADGIMSLAEEYEGTGFVVGLNYWKALVDAGLDEQGRKGEIDEDKFPGCGLGGAKEFGEGWFTDGLHLDVKVSKLSRTWVHGLSN